MMKNGMEKIIRLKHGSQECPHTVEAYAQLHFEHYVNIILPPEDWGLLVRNLPLSHLPYTCKLSLETETTDNIYILY